MAARNALLCKYVFFFLFLGFLQVCNKRDKHLSDPILEKYIINVVFDTINAFFSSPFSENSTSLQVWGHDSAVSVCLPLRLTWLYSRQFQNHQRCNTLDECG